MTKSGASYSMCSKASAGASTDMHLVWGLVSKIMGWAADKTAIAMTATTGNACRIIIVTVPSLAWRLLAATAVGEGEGGRPWAAAAAAAAVGWRVEGGGGGNGNGNRSKQ